MLSKPLWLQIGGVAVVALALVLFGIYARGVYAEAQQADVLRQQIKAAATRQAEQAEVAHRAEAQIQTDRQTITDLTKKWTAARAQQNRPVCLLDPDALGVLRGAAADHAPAR